MFAKLRIITDRKINIVKVPFECVVSRLGQNFIFTVDDTLPTNIEKKMFQDSILDKIMNQDNETEQDQKTKKTIQENKKNQEDKKFVEGLYLYNEGENRYELKTTLDDSEKSRYKEILNDIKYLRVKRNIVKLGIRTENQQEIVSGLKANQAIIQRGQTLLEDGAFIKIIDTVPPIEAKDIVSIK